jgi:hypothetical protein
VKNSAKGGWSLDWDSQGRRPADYWGNLTWIVGANWPANGAAGDYRTELFTQAQAGNNAQSFRINRFEVDSTDPDGLATLEFEFGDPKNRGADVVSAQFKMHPARHWAIASYEVKLRREEEMTVRSAVFSYPADDPESPRSVRREQRVIWPKGELVTQLKLLRYEPWTIDESVFAPESVGIAQSEIDARYRTPWYFWCWGAMAPFTLLAGIGLLVCRRRSSPPDLPDGNPAAAT